MSATPYMKFFNGDFLRKTMHLSAAETGAYFLLIMHYFEHGGLPADEAKIARITRMTPRQWQQSRDTLAAFFEDGWRHRRVEEERDLLLARSATNRRNGSTGGRRNVEKRRPPEVVKTQPPEVVKTRHHKDEKVNDFKDGGQANGSVSLKHSQYHSSYSESERESPDGDSALSRATPAGLDALEQRCRTAAGLETSPAPSLFDLSAIRGWIEQGADLEADVLPTLRAARGSSRPIQSWRYFTARVLEARDRRGAMAERSIVVPFGAAPSLRSDNAARLAAAFDNARAALAGQHEVEEVIAK